MKNTLNLIFSTFIFMFTQTSINGQSNKETYKLLTNLKIQDTLTFTIRTTACIRYIDVENDVFWLIRQGDDYLLECRIRDFDYNLKKTQISKTQFTNLITLMKKSESNGLTKDIYEFIWYNSKLLKDESLMFNNLPRDTIINYFNETSSH